MGLQEKVIELIYLQGKRRDEVAEVIGLSTKIIRTIEREFLKQLVERYFDEK